MHRNVALKVLQRDEEDPDIHGKSARFLAEAMLTGRLTHAGIIPIYHVGYDPAHGYFYSMRYLRGKSMHQIVRERAKQTWNSAEQYSLPRLLEIVVRVCEAVAFGHHNGVLHRDLKPANIMITESNEVLVVDWGLAKDLRTHDPIAEAAADGAGEERAAYLKQLHNQTTGTFLSQARPASAAPGKTALYRPMLDGDGVDEELFNLTQAGMLVGTPWYMSPEQIRGDDLLTPASDVYALGVILYRLLTGAMPVDSKDLTELISRVSAGDIQRIETRPEALRLPRALCNIVNRALAFEAEERYEDAGQLGDDLRLYLEGRTPLAPLLFSGYRDPQTRAASLAEQWDIQGPWVEAEEGMELVEGSVARTRVRAHGDFRCMVGFRARTAPWCLSVLIGEKTGDGTFMAHHEVRMGFEGRSFVELLWMNRRVQRRFDVRLQAGQYYQASIELEDGSLKVRIDDLLTLNYRDVFPATGGSIALRAAKGALVIEDINWRSRGAPLNLSYMYQPDRLFLEGRFGEARQLYQQMAQSHPDREEGLLALYKAGLCSAELKDTSHAFEQFSQLENTMLDHYCTLGLARIGMLDGNVDWAWEALKSGYLRHKHPEVRTEIWFSLLDVLEQLGRDNTGGKLPRYLELLHDLEPMPQELTQISYEYLDLVLRQSGPEVLRHEAISLLTRYGAKPAVTTEALLALWRTAFDETIGNIALGAINRHFAEHRPDIGTLRLLLMRGELSLAQMKLDEAMQVLAVAIKLSEHSRSERLWAMNWHILCIYLKGDFERALSEGRETLQYMDKYSSDQLAYLLSIVTMVLLRSGKQELAHEALLRASNCTGWWGTVAGHVLSNGAPDVLVADQHNPNLASEALFMAGELFLRMANGERAAEYFTACDEHPSRRVMTRQLARARLREMVLLTTAPTSNSGAAA